MLYIVLTRLIFAAEALEDKKKEQHERDEALAAVRMAWKVVRASVEGMIQRQARFEYFEGVGLGALIAIPVLALAGWMAVRYGANQLSEPSEPGSLTAAIIGGAAGAVISVTQRMTANTLVLDFSASKKQKLALGMLRPIVGAVFGAVVYFAMVGGLLAVNARTGKDASIALAFFAGRSGLQPGSRCGRRRNLLAGGTTAACCPARRLGTAGPARCRRPAALRAGAGGGAFQPLPGPTSAASRCGRRSGPPAKARGQWGTFTHSAAGNYALSRALA